MRAVLYKTWAVFGSFSPWKMFTIVSNENYQLYELNTEEEWNKIEIMVQELIYIENYRIK